MSEKRVSQHPLLVHDAVDDVEVQFLEHVAVVAKGVGKIVFVPHLGEAFFVEFADGGHFDLIGEAVDRGVVGALAAPAGADESRFQHGVIPFRAGR